MAGHMGVSGVYLKLGKGNTKKEHGEHRWNLQAERAAFFFSRCF
jgi:hypothetical protein